MEFSRHLKTLREGERLTQEELALRLNVSRSAIAKWEQGKGMPSLELLKSLALFFHTSIDNLLGEEGIVRFEKKQNYRVLTISIIAVTALVIATLSTTLLLLNMDGILIPEVTKIVRADEVIRNGLDYQVNYSENGKKKSFYAGADDISFRGLEAWDGNLTKDDYLKVVLKGNEAKEVIIIDNQSDIGLKGYQIDFVKGQTRESYYYYEYSDDTGDFSFMKSEYNIPSILSNHIQFAQHHFDSHYYNDTTVTHTIFLDSHAIDYNLIELNRVEMNAVGDTTSIRHMNSYAAGVFSRLNIRYSGYLNSASYQGDDYRLRNLINYDTTLEYVDTIEEVRLVEYDQNDVVVQERLFTEAPDSTTFTLAQTTSYMKYYVDDSIKGKTLEAGEIETLFFTTGQPLPQPFRLSLGE